MRNQTALTVVLSCTLALCACEQAEDVAKDWAGGWGAPDKPVKDKPVAAPKNAPTTTKGAPPAVPPAAVEPRGSRTRKGDDAAQVLVPAGRFRMGRTGGAAHEGPERVVHITRDFWIDQKEVSVAQWARCVAEGGCKASQASDYKERGGCNWNSPRPDSHPMNCIGTPGAEAYCAWAGGVLPSEAQWEYAARGDDGRAWPIGKEPGCSDAAWSGTGGACAITSSEPTGVRALDVSPFAVHDMTGNVREWTADWYVPDAYTRLTAKNPLQTARTRHRVSRGGTYHDRTTNNLRSTYRHKSFADVRQPHNGFRCIGGTAQ